MMIVLLMVAGFLSLAAPARSEDGIEAVGKVDLYAFRTHSANLPPPIVKVATKPNKRRRMMWTGLALAGAGAAVFATAGHTVNVAQQCALVPLGSFCLPAKSYRDYRQGQQLTGAAMVAAGGYMAYVFGTRP